MNNSLSPQNSCLPAATSWRQFALCRREGDEMTGHVVAAGSGTLRLIARHLLPHLARPRRVGLTVSVGQALVLEATLSFLNLGVPANVPSWGNLLGSGMRAALSGAWWVVSFPGLAIVLAVVSINFVGDGLRDAADPRSRLRL